MGREHKDHEAARVTVAPTERERRLDLRQGALRAVGIAAARLAAPIIARRGGGLLGRLKADWTVVVGAEFAAASWPEALGRDGALKLRVASSAALELQHRTPLVIERINLFFGRAVVARLILIQGPLPLAVPLAPASLAPPLDAEAARALDTRLGGIADPELRAALARLGRLVMAGAQRRA